MATEVTVSEAVFAAVQKNLADFNEAVASVADPGKVAVCGMAVGVGRGVEWSQPNNPLDFKVAPTDADYVADLERLNAEQSEMLRLAEGEALWRAAAKAQTDQDRERIASLERENAGLKRSLDISQKHMLAASDKTADFADDLMKMRESRDYWQAEAIRLRDRATTTFVASTEAALVERAFPENALKHSR